MQKGKKKSFKDFYEDDSVEEKETYKRNKITVRDIPLISEDDELDENWN